jgi:hypothetical protein
VDRSVDDAWGQFLCEIGNVPLELLALATVAANAMMGAGEGSVTDDDRGKQRGEIDIGICWDIALLYSIVMHRVLKRHARNSVGHTMKESGWPALVVRGSVWYDTNGVGTWLAHLGSFPNCDCGRSVELCAYGFLIDTGQLVYAFTRVADHKHIYKVLGAQTVGAVANEVREGD